MSTSSQRQATPLGFDRVADPAVLVAGSTRGTAELVRYLRSLMTVAGKTHPLDWRTGRPAP